MTALLQFNFLQLWFGMGKLESPGCCKILLGPYSQRSVHVIYGNSAFFFRQHFQQQNRGIHLHTYKTQVLSDSSIQCNTEQFHQLQQCPQLILSNLGQTGANIISLDLNINRYQPVLAEICPQASQPHWLHKAGHSRTHMLSPLPTPPAINAAKEIKAIKVFNLPC